MTVHFIGAGPGDPDLITVRGLRLIKSCALCLYAGSLVPQAVVAEAPDDARILDTAAMTLDDIIAETNNYGNILKENMIITNVKSLSIEEIDNLLKTKLNLEMNYISGL